MYDHPQSGLMEAHSFNLDCLSQDIHQIKQTLQGWTTIFSQLMEITIETHKQNQYNASLLQQLIATQHRRHKHSQPKDQIKLSPIRPHKTEPDEVIKQENFSKIFNNPKKISIMQLQGTPFDSAFESINKELEEPYREDQYLSVPKSMQMSVDLNKQKKNQQLELQQPQSAKNTYENKQFAFNTKVMRSQDIKANKENHQHHSSMNRPDSKRILDQPQLSTVVEENQSPCMSPYENNFRYSIAQSHRQYEQCSTAKTSQNSQRPLNYFQQQQLQSENNRSSSKSCYGNQQTQVLQNNNNLINQQQQAPQQISSQNPFLNNLNNASTKNVKQAPTSTSNIPFKQQFEIMNQISNQRAKSYSEQNCKKQLSKRCLDIDIFDKQYETSQELIWKAQKTKK
ncbi:unnamed protein product [Paramecium pentaurelia]|uniref:Uncharacterized protein n=1 Tax=Paramecium pentaurelia TaxID=43138 RepID=A0A8S1S875_9CILI|nr:unnamed protein product [Paramecium pentaurelia]